MALERELETFKQKLPELRDSEGKYALVHGDELVTFTSYEDALKEGYRRYGLEPFMVKQVRAIEPVQRVTRRFVPPAVR